MGLPNGVDDLDETVSYVESESSTDTWSDGNGDVTTGGLLVFP